MAYQTQQWLERKKQVEGYRQVALCALVRDRDLRDAKGGWCPGTYFTKCTTCGTPFVGAKHACLCADCAYGTEPKRILTYEEQETARIRSTVTTDYLT
jgi:hypothetical protein